MSIIEEIVSLPLIKNSTRLPESKAGYGGSPYKIKIISPIKK